MNAPAARLPREYGMERAWGDLRLNRIGAGADEIMLE